MFGAADLAGNAGKQRSAFSTVLSVRGDRSEVLSLHRRASMKIDFNDLYYFCEIVRHGGIAAAERATREPKSKLSRRLAHLEDRLGVRLVERSTRRFRVTEVGQTFFQHCR